MTVEDLHDALTLLPAELVAEADKRRGRKPVKIQWRRLAGMAACLVVILGCSFWLWITGLRMGGAKSSNQMTMAAPAACDEAAPEDAPMNAMLQGTPTEADSNEKRAAASGAAMDQGASAPGILNMTWVETPCKGRVPGEGTAFLASSGEALEAYLKDCEKQGITGLREGTTGYDADWFENHDLVLIPLTCGADASVESVREAEGQWKITLSVWRVSLLRNYHLLLETEKGAIESADHVTITYAES